MFTNIPWAHEFARSNRLKGAAEPRASMLEWAQFQRDVVLKNSFISPGMIEPARRLAFGQNQPREVEDLVDGEEAILCSRGFGDAKQAEWVTEPVARNHGLLPVPVAGLRRLDLPA